MDSEFQHSNSTHNKTSGYAAVELQGDIEQSLNHNDLTLDTRDTGAQGATVGTGTYSAVIEILVPMKQREYFSDEWSSLIYDKVSTYKGFRARHIHLLNEKDGYLEYMTVLVFNDFDSFNFWQQSEDRKRLVGMLEPRGIKSMLINAYGGCHNEDYNTQDAVMESSPKSPTGRVVKQNSLTGTIPRPMPPPKWKLMLILMMTVYCSLMTLDEGSLTIALLKANQPAGFTTLVGITIIVTCLTYSFLPLIMSIPFINKWLRQPRSVSVDEMHPIHSLLDQGLLIFAAETHEFKVPKELMQRVAKLEARCDKLRSVNHELRVQMSSLNDTRSSISGVDPATVKHEANPSLEDISSKTVLLTGEHTRDSNVPITMAVRHSVKWECVPDFEKWTDDIDKEMARHSGYLGMVKIDATPGENVFINSFTFDTFDNMVAFTRSRTRDQLLARLEPMLESTSAYQLNEERSMGNAFSELLVSTGGTVPVQPPPMWKSCILIICPLFILVFQLGQPLGGYLAEANIYPFVSKFIGVAVLVPIMTYFGIPTMHMFFGKWLNMPRKKCLNRTYYKHLEYLEFLDTGIPVYMQVIILITFVLANLLSDDVSE